MPHVNTTANISITSPKDYVKHGENVHLDHEQVNVTDIVDLKARRQVNVAQSSIVAGKGINIQGGSITMSGGSMISGGNIKISGKNVSLNGATITSSGDLNINSDTMSVADQVLLDASRVDLRSQALNISDNSELDVHATEFDKYVDQEHLGHNASINFKLKNN